MRYKTLVEKPIEAIVQLSNTVKVGMEGNNISPAETYKKIVEFATNL